MKLTKVQRAELKQKFGGRCAYCGDVLNDRFHADHVEAIYRDKFYPSGMFKPHHDTIDNLFPACAPCNLFKMTYNIEQFRYELQLQTERAKRSSNNYRTALRFGSIIETQKPIVFYFETYSAPEGDKP